VSPSRILVVLGLTVIGVGCAHEAAPARHAHAHSTVGGERRADPQHETAAVAAHEERQNEPPTASAQSDTTDDVEITRQIRVAVVGDSSLSFGARLCTIVTRDAIVTLRGDVATNDERDSIERHAHAVTGVMRVENLLSVSE
jgi:osmotically-inducible protein OsmY